MSPNKRKMPDARDFSDDSSPKCRRSSLKVNLSFTSNLSDSEDSQKMNNKTADVSGKKNLSSMASYKERFNLKELRVSLIAISEKEKSLSSSCEQLKDAIISKTNEIFNKQSELSIKTSTVLARNNDPNKNELEKRTRERLPHSQLPPISKTVFEVMKTLINRPTNSDIIPSTNTKIIETTPRSTKEMKSIDKSKYPIKRHLFPDKKNNGSLRLANNANSPIISGSNRRRTTRHSMKTSSQLESMCNKENNRNTIIHGSQSNSSIASISENENLFAGNQFVCSTFIQREQNSDTESENCRTEIQNNKCESTEDCTKNNAFSTEYITIRRTASVKYNSLPEKSKESSNIQSKCAVINPIEVPPQDESQEIKNCTVRSLSLKQKSVKSTTINMEIPMELTEIQNNDLQENVKQMLLHEESSVKTIPSSLRMNTSIDSLSETEDAPMDIETQLPIRESDQSDQFSTHTMRSSMQVNTSLDSVRRTLPRIINVQRLTNEKWVDVNSEKATEQSPNKKRMSTSKTESDTENQYESLDNSIIKKKLKDSTTQAQRSCKSDSTEVLHAKEIEHNNNNEVAEIQPDTGENNRRKSSSYVEGTQYPTSRSVLLKSQLKQFTMIPNLNSKFPTCDKKEPIKPSVKFKQTERDTIIRDDSVCMESPKSQRKCIVIEDSTNGDKSLPNENHQCPKEIENVPTKGKKKLLPLCNEDLISFSPIQEQSLELKRPEVTTKRRNTRKKLNKINSVLIKKKMNIAVQEDHNNYNDLNNLKVKKQQPKKPRKVLSKKIVIKKYTNHDLLNELEKSKVDTDTNESRSSSNRNSFAEFEKNKKLPTRWQYSRSQKIMIATTGLSQEDKNLVKSIAKTLGGAEVESHVTRRTTHLISTGVRTVNLLHGIIRGCWLISLEWILKSLESNKWLDPQDYEMKHFSKAVQENRKDRQLFGQSYVPELFATCGFVYVENGTVPPTQVLKDLIKSAGGRIIEDFRLAKIVIGKEGLKETWVLDSITTGELQPVHQYRRK